MSARKGFLLVTMEPPPAMEEEFNDWYDTEHVPERLSVSGFETATRYVCTSGWPRYMAFYDLEDAGVIDSPGYQAIACEKFSPWTKRILARARGFYRAYGEQIYPGARLRGSSARMLLIRFRGVATAADELMTSVRQLEARDEVTHVRVFHCTVPADDVLVTVEMASPLLSTTAALPGLGALATKIATINEYTVYAGAGLVQDS